MFLYIDGKSIRTNIHVTTHAELTPVIRTGVGTSAMGAIVNGSCSIHYDPAGSPETGTEVWIETETSVTLSDVHLASPDRVGWCVATHLPNHRSNRKTQREGLKRPLKPVISLRYGYGGKGQFGNHLHIPSSSKLIYANPLDRNSRKLKCGAFLYLLCISQPIWIDSREQIYQSRLF